MAQAFRLATGGRIDRSKPLALRFDGRRYEGYAGDTRRLGAARQRRPSRRPRSFKYHRPRGIFSHGSRGAERAAVGRSRAAAASIRTTARHQVEARRRPDRRDRRTAGRRSTSTSARSTTLLSPLFVAGFYYKTFMWPRVLLGQGLRAVHPRAPPASAGRRPTPDPDRYQHRHAHCDVLVVGAGPAGLAAALAASEAGKRVILADEQAEIGGSLLHERDLHHRRQAGAGLARARRSPSSRARDERHGAAAHHRLRLLRPQPRRPGASGSPTTWPHPHAGPAARAAVAGAREAGRAGDRRASSGRSCSPATTGPASCWPRACASSSTATASRPGRRVVIVTNGASAYTAARRPARRPGSTVDGRRPAARRPTAAPEARGLRAAGCEVLAGHTVVGSRGRKRVTGLIVAPIGAPADASARRRTLACDCVGMSGGWTPAVHLFSQSRGKLRFDADDRRLRAGRSPCRRSARPAPPTAPIELAACLAEGWAAGRGRGGPRSARAASTAERRRRTGFRPVPRPADATASRRADAPSSTSRTTSPPRTSASPSARASSRSSTSSATPPPAWRPTRARPST